MVITPEGGGNETGIGEGNAGATPVDMTGGVSRLRWASGGKFVGSMYSY